MDAHELEALEAEYEKVRTEFQFDYVELMNEANLSFKDISKRLGIDVKEFKYYLFCKNLTFREAVVMIAALEGTFRPLIITPRPF